MNVSEATTPNRPLLSELLGDAATLANAMWADRSRAQQDDPRHVLLLDLLHEAMTIAQQTEWRAQISSPRGATPGALTANDESLCPLCNRWVPAAKLENLSRHEFFAHGDCGHFFANWTSVKMIRLGGDQLRNRLKAAVREQNARQLAPVLSNLL